MLELDLQLSLGAILIMKEGFGSKKARRILRRAEELSLLVPEKPKQFTVLANLLPFHLIRGDLLRVLNISKQLLDIAKRTKDAKQKVVVHYMLASTFFFQGRYEESIKHAVLSNEAYRLEDQMELIQMHGLNPALTCIWHHSYSLALLGYFDQAFNQALKVCELGRDAEYPLDLSYVLGHLSFIYYVRGEFDLALDVIEESLKIANQYQFAQLIPQSAMFRGISLIQQKKVEVGLINIEKGLHGWELEINALLMLNFYYRAFADAKNLQGHFEESMIALDRSIELTPYGGDFWLPDIYRMKGDVLHNQGLGDSQVEHWYEQAMHVANEQKAKLLELRAASSWAELHLERGRPDEALALLSPLVNWFTEGHDTADLQRAHALLAQAKGQTA